MMKLVILFVIALIVFSEVLCEELDSSENLNATETPKTKRGILGYPGLARTHAFHYSLPPSYYTSYHSSPYAARFPAVYKNVNHPTTGYALSHGGASVTSYNINYPRYAFHSPKPHIHIPVHSPVPRPIVPTPPVLVAPKPILPVAVPTFASKPLLPIGIPAFSNRIPLILSKPPFQPAPFQPAPFQPAPFHPGLVPFGVQSQFIPIHPTINSFPSAVSPPESVPLPGSTFIHPDQWRPILVNQPTPTAETTPFNNNNIHRPAINLLPPYGQSDSSHQAQLELQQDNYDGYPEEKYAGRVGQLYLSPNPGSEKNQPILHQPFVDQDLSQVGFDDPEQGRSLATFNYDPPSNNGQYTGPSSYEVALGSYTRAF